MADASSRTEPAAELLSVDSIEVIYGGNILAVADVSLHVGRGEIVTLLGSNGAGKSTTLKAISGLIHTDRAQISRGAIRFDGSDVTDDAANLKAKRGIVHVLEGRRVFTHLTVEENLRSGTFVRRRSRRETAADIEEIYTWFPRLKVKLKTRAGLLSGGEQQMLAIGRALLTRPKLVLLDEPSMGLAPIIVEEIFELISNLNKRLQLGFLVAEQNMNVSLRHAHRGYILENGRIALSGSAEDLLARKDLHEFYLGVAFGR